MSPAKNTPKGQKRTSDGNPKPSDPTSQQAQQTPTCAQPPTDPSTSSLEAATTATISDPSPNPPEPPSKPEPPHQPLPKKRKQPQKPTQNQPQKPTKHPRLPPNTTLSKRPLLHPAIPSPYTSSSAPKCVYITTTSPFIPAVKRIRFLLSEIEKRAHQSEGATSKLQANGRLDAKMVERAIAEGSEGAVGASAGKGAGGGSGKGKGRSGRGGVGGEEVFIKAAGKAIQRALELGVHFQKAGDCRVRIELGSVSAIDDIEIKKKKIVDAAEEKDEQRVENDESVNAGAGSPDVIDADKGKEDEVTGIAAKKQSRIGKEKGKGKAKVVNEDHIPETRIRLLSAVTVAISLL